jgi:2-methylfumaryl-CoA isomerase
VRATRVLWSKYRTFTDLAADGARLLRENPLMAEVLQPGVDRHWAPGSPMVMDGKQSLPTLSPLVGQHTDEVLRSELGLSATDLEKLSETGAIRTRSRR